MHIRERQQVGVGLSADCRPPRRSRPASRARRAARIDRPAPSSGSAAVLSDAVAEFLERCLRAARWPAAPAQTAPGWCSPTLRPQKLAGVDRTGTARRRAAAASAPAGRRAPWRLRRTSTVEHRPILARMTLMQLAFLSSSALKALRDLNQGRGSIGRPALRISKYSSGRGRPPESPSVAMVSPAVTRSPTSL